MGVFQMEIKAAFSSVARGRLIQAVKAKKTDGDRIRWTKSYLSHGTVEMLTQGNILQSQPVEAAVAQCSPISPILFTIHSAGQVQWVKERVQTEGLSFVDNVGCVATGKDGNQLVNRLEAYAPESSEWASRRDLQFDTAKTEASLWTRTIGKK
jgi:hypothetical protein